MGHVTMYNTVQQNKAAGAHLSHGYELDGEECSVYEQCDVKFTTLKHLDLLCDQKLLSLCCI